LDSQTEDIKGPAMAITREFTVLMGNRPSILAKVCRALGGREANILALQSFPNSGKFVIRLIVDKPTVAKMLLTNLQLTFVETQIVQTKIRHRPGKLRVLRHVWVEPILLSTTHTAAWSPVQMRPWFFSALRISTRRRLSSNNLKYEEIRLFLNLKLRQPRSSPLVLIDEFSAAGWPATTKTGTVKWFSRSRILGLSTRAANSPDSLSHAFGCVYDHPNLSAMVVASNGESEKGREGWSHVHEFSAVD
jgi:hypothetical protein